VFAGTCKHAEGDRGIKLEERKLDALEKYVSAGGRIAVKGDIIGRVYRGMAEARVSSMGNLGPSERTSMKGRTKVAGEA